MTTMRPDPAGPSRVFILSTRNLHKAREIAAILGPENRYLTLADFPESPAVVEDGDSFEANARKKAVELAQWLRHRRFFPESGAVRDILVLADDSGLEVEALGGAPGVRSARFAADERGGDGNCRDEANNKKLLRVLEGTPEEKRRARFRCVIAVCPLIMNADGEPPIGGQNLASETGSGPVFFSGTCPGRILPQPRGLGGFGYDPLFVPDGYERTYAELGESEKNALSHRGKALAKLAEWLASRGR